MLQISGLQKQPDVRKVELDSDRVIKHALQSGAILEAAERRKARNAAAQLKSDEARKKNKDAENAMNN